MARISLYLPDELKARMDAVADGVNWSEVARPAIASALAAYEHKKGQTMDTAIERLRASKQEADAEDKTEGREHGRTWAKEEAAYRDLQRLAKVYHQRLDGYEPFDLLIKAIDPDGELTQDERLTYLFGRDDFEAGIEYCDAFIEGALELFGEVQDKL